MRRDAVMLAILVLLPAAMAAGSYPVRSARARSAILLRTALVHVALVLTLWGRPGATSFGGWLEADSLGLVVLTLTSTLFVAVAHYAAGYLRTERAPGGRAFVSCMLSFLAAASLV